jgi:predicted oxidoreductase
LSYSKIIAGTMTWGLLGKEMSSKEMAALINHCISSGVTTFDHADIYGDYTMEKDFGLAFKESGVKREAIQLISKCGIQKLSNNRENKVKHYNYSKEYIIQSAEKSLVNLKTDYLDLLLLHRPSPLMQVDEVVEAITHLKQQGKIKSFGISNFSTSQMELLAQHLDIVTNQVECSLTNPEMMFNGVFDYAIKQKQVAMVWSPLGSYFKQRSSQNERIYEQLKSMCVKYNATEDQLLLAWLAKHPADIHPVIGTTNPERISNAVKSMQINLDLEDWFLLLEASKGHRVP